MISILAVTALGLVFGDVQWGGIMSTPPSIAPTFMQLDFSAVFEIGMISVVIAF